MSSRLDAVDVSPRPGRFWLRLGLVAAILACLAGLASSAAYKVREAGTQTA
jgi:hypothetical protein